MKRTIVALGLTGLMLFAAPASAHLKTYNDGSNDAYEAGDTSGTAHVTPLDLSGFSFNEKPKAYKIKIFMQDPLDVSLLCGPESCGGSTIESHGVLDASFYRLVGEEVKNSYLVEVQNDGSDNLVAYLFKASGTSSIAVASSSLSTDGLTVSLSVPRGKINGQTEGRKIYTNALSNYWEASGAGFCEFDSSVSHANACVDWVPDAEDAPHKLQN